MNIYHHSYVVTQCLVLLTAAPCTILPLPLQHLLLLHLCGAPGQLAPHLLGAVPVQGAIVLEGEDTRYPTVGVASNYYMRNDNKNEPLVFMRNTCATCLTVPPGVKVTPPVPPCVCVQCTPQ